METVQKALRTIGGAGKEWWSAPTPEVLPPKFAERLGEDISLLDIFPGGAGVGALTRKAAVGQAARGWRDYLKGFVASQAKGDPLAKQVVVGLKAERTKMTKALAKMSEESLKPLRRVTISPRTGRPKAAMGYRGKWFGELFYHPGKAPGWELIEKDPLEVIPHEILGHLQALSPKKAGKFKKFFREINRELARGGPRAHEQFAHRMGVLTERYHKAKPGPMKLEHVKLLTEMATSEAAWRPELAPFLRPMGK